MDNDIKHVDFDTFIKSVAEEEVLDNYTKIEYSSIVKNLSPNLNMGQNMPITDLLVSPIVYGDKNTVLKTTLLQHANVYNKLINSNAMAKEYKDELGEPTHLVKVDEKTYMIANPEDFKVVYTQEGAYGLLLLAKVRTKIYKG